MADVLSPTPDAPPAQLRVPRAAARPGVRWFGSARFVVCVLVLVAAAVSMKWLESIGKVIFKKEALPLKKPLAQFDRTRMAPEYAPHPEIIRPLSEETEQTLGTKEYVNMIFVDPSRPRDDRSAAAHVFITYYTGQPDMVPHVPDECWLASGYEKVGAWDELIPAPGCGAPDDRIPVRLLRFRASSRGGSGAREFAVMYFFHCNGAYATTRDQVRLLQANLTDRFAYYAKFEIRFTDFSLMQLAGREDSVSALSRLLRKLMQVTLEEHLPDWHAARQAGARASGSHGS